MSIVVCGLFIVTFLYALVSNRDTFSPAKFFLFSFLVFHLGALSGTSSYELWMLILLVLLVGMTAVMFEALGSVPPAPRDVLNVRKLPDAQFFLTWIWLLSLPGILAEVYLVESFGGIQAYVNIMGNRVIEFRGLGWAITLIATLLAFNLAYFAVGLTRRRSRLWWTCYGLHFLILLATGLLSGSRSGILNIFAMQLFCYHYIKRNVRLTRALPIAVALLVFAMVLGVVRNYVKFENDVLTTGLEGQDQVGGYSTFQYGVLPLHILLDADHLQLAYGMTLVSLVTNVVPRDWWPDKPDTGGVFFTKAYTGDAWDGASNLTPTFLGEGIINFGWACGILFFVFTYPAVMYFLVTYYRRVIMRMRATPGPAAAVDLALYVFVMWAVIALMTGEVTTTILGLLLTRLAPIALLKAVLGQRWQGSAQARRARVSQGHSDNQPLVSA